MELGNAKGFEGVGTIKASCTIGKTFVLFGFCQGNEGFALKPCAILALTYNHSVKKINRTGYTSCPSWL